MSCWNVGALRIMYNYTNDMPYINALYCASIPSLAGHRERLSWKFFTSLLQPSSCLHILLPTPRDPIITTRLRSANKFSCLPSHTRKYQTFISYALAHYQKFITIPSPITIQFVVDVFVLYVFCSFHCTALLCHLVLWPQSWINSTTTTTTNCTMKNSSLI